MSSRETKRPFDFSGHRRDRPSSTADDDRRGSIDDAELSRLLERWVERAFPDDEDGVTRTFIGVEFQDRLRSYQRSARRWRAAQILLWMVAAILALLISIFAGFKTGHGFTIVAGAVVALLTTLTNALHPAREADGYQDARLALRDQGWSLLIARMVNQTNDKDAAAEYQQFSQQIRKIVETKRTTTKVTLGGGSTPAE